MPDETNEAVVAPVSPVVVMTFPNLEGERSFDCAAIPAEQRMDFLKGAVRGYIQNRLNAATQTYTKANAPWAAYDEACKADPLQTIVVKPEGERPAPADLEDAYNRAIDALVTGKVRKQGGDKKAKVKMDPLTTAVTGVVVREVFTSKHAANPKYTFAEAKKEVGDGIAYLNALIEAKAAQGIDRAALEKMRDAKYINPAKVMLGLTDNKATKDLPSLL